MARKWRFLPVLILLLVALTPAGAAWTTSYDSPETKIFSLAVYNNKLYAGTYINGIIYAYNGTTWQTSYDSPEAVIRSLTTYNGRLYAGTEDNGIIYVYNGTSWAVSYDTPELSVSSLGVYNNRLYAGTYPNGKIYVYDGTSWSLSLDTPESAIWSFAVYRNKLYASAQSRGVIYVYDGTSWTESYQSTDPMVISLAVYNNTPGSDKLYAGTCSHGYVHVYDGASWNTSSPGIGTCIGPMAIYNNKLYAYGGGSIYAFNGTSWSLISGGSGGVLSLSAYDGRLYAGAGDDGVVYAYEEPATTPTPILTPTTTPTPTSTATPNITQTPTPAPTAAPTQTPTATPNITQTPTPTPTQAVNLTYMECISPNICMVPDEGSKASCTMVLDKSCQLWYTKCYSCPEKREEYGNCTAYQYGFYNHRFDAAIVNEICKSDPDNFDWKARGWPEHPSGKRGDETINRWIARVNKGSSDQPWPPAKCSQFATWATNPEGKNCRQFLSPCDVPRNWIVVDSCLPANKTSKECDNCPYGDSCIPFGTRWLADDTGMYCDFATKSALSQKNDGALCQNSYECKSNYCADGTCISIQKELKETKSLLQQILDFLKELFKAFTIVPKK